MSTATRSGADRAEVLDRLREAAGQRLTDEAVEAEAAVLDALADLTTVLGPWRAARLLFDPGAPAR